MRFYSQDYWSWCPPSERCANPGIEPISPASATLQEDSLALSHQGSPKSDRERQISYDITYTLSLKKWYKFTYLQDRNRFTNVDNKLMVTKWKMGRGKNQEIGIDIYALIYIKLEKEMATHSSIPAW